MTGVDEVWVDVESDRVDSGRAEEQHFVRGWRLHVGCWLGDCLLTSDKLEAASSFSLDGALMRWSVAHFGQT